MVAYGQMLPIREQGTFRIAEHFPHVPRMVFAAVEIRVIPYVYRQMQRRIRLQHQKIEGIGKVAHSSALLRKQALEFRAKGPGSGLPSCQHPVEPRRGQIRR